MMYFLIFLGQKKRWSQWQALLGATPGFPESVFRLGSPRPSKLPLEGDPLSQDASDHQGWPSIFSRVSQPKPLKTWLASWVGGRPKPYPIYLSKFSLRFWSTNHREMFGIPLGNGCLTQLLEPFKRAMCLIKSNKYPLFLLSISDISVTYNQEFLKYKV